MNSLLRRVLLITGALLLAGLASGCFNNWTSPAMEDVRRFSADEQTYTPELKAEVARFRSSQEQFWVRPAPIR